MCVCMYLCALKFRLTFFKSLYQGKLKLDSAKTWWIAGRGKVPHTGTF